jgi:3-hydroxy acid dehydrogenase/malonic semialdehyde reductase
MKDYVLITGATSGFGEACAQLFANHKYNLILTGRRQERLVQLRENLREQEGIDVIDLCFDVRNEIDVNRAIDSLGEEIRSSLTILINNAGLAVGRGPINEGITDDWERMIDTNVKGLLYVTRAISPIFKSNKKGHIINVSSIAGKEVYPGGNVYCASKHAVDALSKAMRIDLLPHNIRVTNIAPGAAETEFSIVRFKGDKATAKSIYDGFKPLSAEDVADVIFFAATRPPHVTLNDITIMPTAQANGTIFHRE